MASFDVLLNYRGRKQRVKFEVRAREPNHEFRGPDFDGDAVLRGRLQDGGAHGSVGRRPATVVVCVWCLCVGVLLGTGHKTRMKERKNDLKNTVNQQIT